VSEAKFVGTAAGLCRKTNAKTKIRGPDFFHPRPFQPSSIMSPSTASAPIIFLDIDGVICCNTRSELEVDKLKRLKRICSETNATVVLSSDWRRQKPLKDRVQRALERLRISYIGCTSQRTKTQDIGNRRWDIPCRPLEITDWLKKFRSGPGSCAFVAIDDRELTKEAGGAALEGHFVRTDPWWGLTADAADQAIAILRGESGGTRSAPPPPSASGEGREDEPGSGDADGS